MKKQIWQVGSGKLKRYGTPAVVYDVQIKRMIKNKTIHTTVNINEIHLISHRRVAMHLKTLGFLCRLGFPQFNRKNNGRLCIK